MYLNKNKKNPVYKIDLFFVFIILFSLNTIREICSRCYLAMDEDLLHDLSKYKSYRDKSVSASSRSLIQLFREKNPQLLERKDRGKPTEFQRDLVPLDYGQSNPKLYLEGAEILHQDANNHDEQLNDEKANEQSEDGWIDVSHSDEDDDNGDDHEEKGDKQENVDKVKAIFSRRSIRKS